MNQYDTSNGWAFEFTQDNQIVSKKVVLPQTQGLQFTVHIQPSGALKQLIANNVGSVSNFSFMVECGQGLTKMRHEAQDIYTTASGVQVELDELSFADSFVPLVGIAVPVMGNRVTVKIKAPADLTGLLSAAPLGTVANILVSIVPQPMQRTYKAIPFRIADPASNEIANIILPPFSKRIRFVWAGQDELANIAWSAFGFSKGGAPSTILEGEYSTSIQYLLPATGAGRGNFTTWLPVPPDALAFLAIIDPLANPQYAMMEVEREQ